jgi:hypothetical protein
MSFASFVRVPKRDDQGNIIIDPETGRPIEGLGINPIKPHVRGYWLADPDQPSIVLPASGGANVAGAQKELNFLIDFQGHFDWNSIVGVSTGAFMVEFFDPGTSRRLQNRPVHSSTIVGVAARQFRLPEPYFFNIGDAQRQLKCYLRDLSGSQNTVRLNLVGRRIYHKEAPPDVALDLDRIFGYGSRTYSYFLVPNETKNDGTVTPVSASGTASFTFESDASADTEVQKLMVASTGAFSFTLRERATNRQLMPNSVHSQNGWGNAEFPFYFADSYLLERQKQIIMDVTDLSGSQNYIYPVMASRRLQLIP